MTWKITAKPRLVVRVEFAPDEMKAVIDAARDRGISPADFVQRAALREAHLPSVTAAERRVMEAALEEPPVRWPPPGRHWRSGA
jgi:hypothetical protein